MHRFIDGEDRMQPTLLPHGLEDYLDEENLVRVIEVFIATSVHIELDPGAPIRERPQAFADKAGFRASKGN
jgi:hypothetical protein